MVAKRRAGFHVPSAGFARVPTARGLAAARNLAAGVCTTALALALAGAGCSGPDAGAEDTLRVALESFPVDLDPRRSTDAASSRIGSLVFSGLTAPDDDGGRRLEAAAEIRRPNSLTWVVRLRPDLHIADGSALGAEGVVATYRSVLDPAAGSPKRALLDSLDSVEAVDAHTVLFRLRRRDASFAEATGIGILPARLAARPRVAAAELVGSGPYRIARVVDGDLVRLERPARDPETPPGRERASSGPAAIEFRTLPDQTMRALELRHGSIDLVHNALDPDTVAWIQAHEPRLQVASGPYDGYQYLGLNHRHEALRQLQVRRAIALALDRDAIVAHLLRGQATVADGLLPPHHRAYSAEARLYSHNPERARRMLDAAGWPDPAGPQPRLVLSYKTSTSELGRRIGEVLAAQLAEVGIALRIESLEWGTFYGDIRKGRFDLYSLSWVGIRDPDIYRTVFHSGMQPPAGNNRGAFRDGGMDRLTDLARGSDDTRRLRLYRRVHKREARLLPYIPLWWPAQVVVAGARVERLAPHPSGSLEWLARVDLKAPRR